MLKGWFKLILNLLSWDADLNVLLINMILTWFQAYDTIKGGNELEDASCPIWQSMSIIFVLFYTASNHGWVP